MVNNRHRDHRKCNEKYCWLAQGLVDFRKNAGEGSWRGGGMGFGVGRDCDPEYHCSEEEEWDCKTDPYAPTKCGVWVS